MFLAITKALKPGWCLKDENKKESEEEYVRCFINSVFCQI
jgi:hypothetical protein